MVHLELRTYSRIFGKIQKANGDIGGSEEDDSLKKPEVKILVPLPLLRKLLPVRSAVMSRQKFL
jgi:hypothetical protein